jgi:ribosomal protein L7/L12
MPQCPACNRDVSPSDERCSFCGASLVDDGSREFENELRALLQQGNKIQAIKLFRERTGADLRQAKEAVEAFEMGAALPPPTRMHANLEQDLLVQLERGKKIEAIKIYRAATGVGLKEAKEAVEALAAQHGLTGRAGCLGIVVLFMMFAAACFAFFDNLSGAP